jgi:hypothetical protein
MTHLFVISHFAALDRRDRQQKLSKPMHKGLMRGLFLGRWTHWWWR